MQYIYLDNAATTRVSEKAANEVYKVLTSVYGNPSSNHSIGIEAEKIIYESRKKIARLISCDADCIIFTSGGTESNNLAIMGSINIKDIRNKKIITSGVEHPSVIQCMKNLENQGFNVNYIAPNKEGIIDPKIIWDLIDENTVLVSIMHVNNETGNIYDIKTISKGIRYKNPSTIIHSDGIQAFGKMNINIDYLDVDLYSFSGHKIHAPKGIGGLYVKKGINIKPIILGGSQENKKRGGTENVSGIAGMGIACEEINIDENLEHIKTLSSFLLKELSVISNIHINSIGNVLEYILNFSIEGQKSEIILNKLKDKGIYVSNGAACSKSMYSKVLKNMGIDKKYIDSAIRVSFSKYNTLEEVEKLIECIKIL